MDNSMSQWSFKYRVDCKMMLYSESGDQITTQVDK